jgi:hypothetical protein
LLSEFVIVFIPFRIAVDYIKFRCIPSEAIAKSDTIAHPTRPRSRETRAQPIS